MGPHTPLTTALPDPSWDFKKYPIHINNCIFQVPKGSTDLTGAFGRVVLTEYLDQHPVLLQKIGMASRLCTYYRKKSPEDDHEVQVFVVTADIE